MNWRPSAIILPQETSSVPRPRKLSAASARMKAPMVMEKMTISGAKMLGKIWKPMILVDVAPIVRAASTYGISRIWITLPRTIRLVGAMPRTESESVTQRADGSVIDAIRRRNAIGGKL